MAMISLEDLRIQANLVFLYYKDLPSAEDFYANTLGLEMVLDYGFAKLFRISKTTYVGLVDESQGLHRFSDEKAVTVSFITSQIEEWYALLTKQGLQIREALSDGESIPVRTFVTYDIAGYFLEFDLFYEDEKNTKICDYLK
jgi:hypothetical protein